MRYLLTSLLCVFTLSLTAQTSWNAEMVSGATKNVWSGINSYTASDDSFWEVGQEITLGNPSGQGQFNFISVGTGVMTPVTQATPGYAGTNAIIKKIVVSGTKRAGRNLWLKTEGLFPMNIRLEKCIELGEIETDGYSSDQALEELKKAKDYLDLGLMTQEEFDALKAKLIKYIDSPTVISQKEKKEDTNISVDNDNEYLVESFKINEKAWYNIDGKHVEATVINVSGERCRIEYLNKKGSAKSVNVSADELIKID